MIEALDTVLADLRYAARGLARSPGFTAVAVLTIGLGIGGTAAIFSVVNGVLLRSLPYTDPGRLVFVAETNLAKGYLTSVSPANFTDWKAVSRSFQGMGAWNAGTAALSGDGGAVRLSVCDVTVGLFGVLGVAPQAGRGFLEEEGQRGKNHVVLLGSALARTRFGDAASAVGKTLTLDGVPYTVTGVMPAAFRFPIEGADAWVPFMFPKDLERQRGAHYLSALGRLAPGVSLAAARREMDGLAARMALEHARTNKGYGVTVTSLEDAFVGNARPALLVLFGAVGLVALIACANVANLLLARAARRRGEMAVRTAIGASAPRLVRQLLTESLLLALLGGGVGLLVAFVAVDLLVRFGPADLPRLAEVGVDGRAVVFTGGLALLTSFLFGLAPALSAARPDLIRALRSRDASGEASGRGLRGGLVAAEIALTVVLLAGAGLLLRSFVTLLAVDSGLKTEGVLTFSLSLPDARYKAPSDAAAFTERVLTRLKALPGVASDGAIFGLPLTQQSFSSSFTVEGAPVPPEDEPSAQVRLATRGALESLGIGLVRGRLFQEQDRAGAPAVVLASEAAVRRFWPNADPIGKRLKFGARPGPADLGGEIVGVVRDVRYAGLETPPVPLFYVAMEQTGVAEFTVVLRGAGSPDALAEPARRIVAALDPELPVSDVKTLRVVVEESVARPRFAFQLLTSFALLALFLAAIGVYAVMAYSVSQRKRELGVRIALGAGAFDIKRLVVGDALKPVAIGFLLGLLGTLLATRALRGLLFGVSPVDPATLTAAAAILAAVALCAAYGPARTASRVDPLTTLRAD